MKYAMSLATIGLDGIKDLANAGKAGFTILKNSTVSQIMQQTKKAILTGFPKGMNI